MAFTALKQCTSRMQGPLSIRTLATSSASRQQPERRGMFREVKESHAAFPIAIIGAFVLSACYLGFHTAKQQLFHSPSVQVTKKKRECMAEVDYPDAVIKSAGKFQNKSHLRKVGHIQDREYTNYTQANPFSRDRKCETLKTIGVPTQEK